MPGARANLAFQSEPDYVPPVWPAEPGRQQMMLHLDIGVRDLSSATVDAVALGAVEAAVQFEDDVRVLLDPAGHPFCLYVDADVALGQPHDPRSEPTPPTLTCPLRTLCSAQRR